MSRTATQAAQATAIEDQLRELARRAESGESKQIAGELREVVGQVASLRVQLGAGARRASSRPSSSREGA